MRSGAAREQRWLVALFLLTLPAVTARLYASDEIEYFAYLRSLWFDRDVSFDNEYRHFYDIGVARTDGFRDTFLVPVTPTGKRENFATLGCALLWAPFYAVADVTARLAGSGSRRLAADGYSSIYIAAVAYGSAFYGFLALILSIRAATRLTGDGVLAGVAVWFGTPLLFYMYAAPGFSHACSAFAVAVFVTVWLQVRERWTPRGLAALGAAAALMAMVREQDVFYAAGPALDFVWSRWRNRPVDVRASAAAAAAGIAGFVLVYSPQLLAYLSLNGRPGPSTLVARKMTWTSPHAVDVLASPRHGLLIWTPLVLLALAGLLWLWRAAAAADRAAGTRHRQPAAICVLLMLLLQIYVTGSVESWTVAGAFGQRRFVGATILLVIGLAALWQSLPRGVPRLAAGVAIAAAVWWNVGLMALFGAGLMDRQRLEVRRNAYDVFVTLPRIAPDLAYRYAVERETFFKPSAPQR